MERTSSGGARCGAGNAIGQHLVPIVIAVTGHRDLRAEDVSRLEHSVRQLFLSLRKRYPTTPLRLLSGLAEGADRLAARVALQQSVDLVAVLPMPRADYEQDFSSPESVQEFRHLLTHARGEIVIATAISRHGERRTYYSRQGVYIVEHCDILLALWDGEQSGTLGGTAEVVRFRIEGVPIDTRPLESYLDSHVGDVYQIVTPRTSKVVTNQDCGHVHLLKARGAGQRAVTQGEPDPTLAAINALNRCLTKCSEHSDANLVPLASHSNRDLQDWRARFRLLDSLAIEYQVRTWRCLALMLLCSLLAMVGLQLQTILPGASQFLQLVYFSMLLAAYCAYGWSKLHQFESKAFDYRALAEGLRIQSCWREAGMNASVADHYLCRQQDVLKWIRRAMRNWESLQDARQIAESITPSSLNVAMKEWIQDQMRFFDGAATRQRRLNRWFVSAANGLVLLGLLIGALKWWSSPWPWLFPWATMPPTIAATLLIYSKSRAWSEQVNQYESMRTLYEVAEHNLRQLIVSGDVAAGKRLLTELGQEALAENADWLILHRRRPLRAPAI